MNEFDAIETWFAPLSRRAAGAFGLKDDAATLETPPGHELVVSVDTTVRGVHARLEDPPDMVARKALRAALSDLAAKGAVPIAYTLALMWPAELAIQDMALVARGLATDQDHFGVPLIGGDTTRGGGELALTIGVFGSVAAGAMVRRCNAQIGDGVFVTGAIGDAGLGLRVLGGAMATAPESAKSHLRRRYLLPEPRLSVAAALRAHAHAAIDVSDGLFADLGHIAAASGVGVEVEASSLPYSAAAEHWVARQPDRTQALGALCAMGDDYEVAFTAREADFGAFSLAGVEVTRIGRVVAEPGVRFLDPSGEVAPILKSGFTHF